MVRRAFVQRSLGEVWLPDGDKLWDPALRAIDAVLTDDGLVDQVVEIELAASLVTPRRRLLDK